MRHIVALRGDPPTDGGRFAPHPGGYRNAAELVAGLKAIAPFEISVAAYPECHPEAESFDSDLANLKAKFDAGATRAITQFFFSPETYFRFCDKARAAGIVGEIVPGILPVSNVAQTRKIAAMCGTAIPAWMDRLFEGLGYDYNLHSPAKYRRLFGRPIHGIGVLGRRLGSPSA